jgi:hypothetical protein
MSACAHTLTGNVSASDVPRDVILSLGAESALLATADASERFVLRPHQPVELSVWHYRLR